MTAVVGQTESLTFEAPGGGSWMLDTTHHGRRPVSRYLQGIYLAEFPEALGVLCERFGLPLAGFRAEMVHGCFYMRPMGIGEPENPKGDPPLVVMKLLARLHPTLRRRNRIAKQAWTERRWREDVDHWFDHDREIVTAANLALQQVDVRALDDEQLADHLHEVTQHFIVQARASGSTHGGDIIPVGDLMAHCTQWGIDLGTAAGLLAGSSPASLDTAHLLAPVGAAVAAAEHPLTSVADVRALSAEADAAVDAWLRHHGHRVVTSDDIDGETLSERPDLQLKALLAADAQPTAVEPPASDAVRARVPAEHRDLFDDLLAEARYGLRLRDDNVGVRWNWPAGLLRRALLEAGERLVQAGRLAHRDHAIEYEPAEVRALLRGDSGPSRQDMTERWQFRQLVLASSPPLALGPESGDPPLAAFPKPLARATAAMLAMIRAMEGEHTDRPLHGVGVGATPHTGRAVVVADGIEALERAEPGDVVVAPLTGPSWNSILPLLGGLVVEEGGAMSHAAIVAREFGIPTVVGVADATRLIPDGAQVTLDPTTGQVTIAA